MMPFFSSKSPFPRHSDLGGKALLYAQAGIMDYWVARPEEGRVMVHRDPTPEGYGSVTRFAETDTLTPLAIPDVTWPCATCWALHSTRRRKPV